MSADGRVQDSAPAATVSGLSLRYWTEIALVSVGVYGSMLHPRAEEILNAEKPPFFGNVV